MGSAPRLYWRTMLYAIDGTCAVCMGRTKLGNRLHDLVIAPLLAVEIQRWCDSWLPSNTAGHSYKYNLRAVNVKQTGSCSLTDSISSIGFPSQQYYTVYRLETTTKTPQQLA